MTPEQQAALVLHQRRFGIGDDDVVLVSEREGELVLKVGAKKGRERVMVLDGQGQLLKYGR